MSHDEPWEEDAPVDFPIRDVIDLHTFRPNEVGSLLPDYFAACREKGIYRVRVIHGKGTGALREGVHRLLEGLPEVESFNLAGPGDGGWGTTWVVLKQ